MAALYPIRAVAQLTGISPDTLRAWERRYRAVAPDRSGRGRLYGEIEIARLRRLNRLVQRGHAIGGIAALDDLQLDALLEAPPEPATTLRPLRPALIEPVLAAVEAFDAVGAQDELGRLATVQPPAEFIHETVLPLMREVGVRWHDGRLTVAQEHLVSQMLRNLLGSLLRLYRPASPSRRLVAATPPGERHEFGIMAASMLAAMSGIEVVYLGADLPAGETARVAHLVNAGAILYGITIRNKRTPDDVRTVAAAMPPTAELWLGGAEAASVHDATLRSVRHLDDLRAFEDTCRQWRH